MAYINGYKYITENEAIAAQYACGKYYGIPVNAEYVTQHWCDYYFAELNESQFWYIEFDESLLPILGEPIEFEVTEPDEIN
jgi:hypothetical protein